MIPPTPRRSTRTAVAALAALLIAPAADAVTRIGTEFPISAEGPSPYPHGRPAIAAYPGRGFVVAWTGAHAADHTGGILARRFQPDGSPAGEPFLVNSRTENAQSAPSIAMDASGAFVAAWTSQAGGGLAIAARRFDPAGVPLADEFEVDGRCAGPVCPGYSAVAADAAGNFVIAWRTPGGDHSAITAQRFGSDGQPSAPSFPLGLMSAVQFGGPSIAMNPSGEFVIAWSRGARDGTVVRRYGRDGTALGGELQASAGHSLPFVAMGTGGDFVVVLNNQSRRSSVVRARRFDGDGNPTGEVTRVNRLPGPSGAGVALGGNGESIAVWANAYGIAAHRLDVAGAQAGGEVLVNTSPVPPPSRGQASIASLGADQFVAVWADATGVAGQRLRLGKENPPVANVLSRSYALEGEPFALDVGFTEPTTQPFRIHFAFRGIRGNRGPRPGIDFAPTPEFATGEAIVPAGVTEASLLSLPTCRDAAAFEGSESMAFTLSPPTSGRAAVGDNHTGTFGIRNDPEHVPVVTVMASTTTVREGGRVDIEAVLDTASACEVVAYRPATLRRSSTATAPGDFRWTEEPVTIRFAPGETRVRVASLRTLEDAVVEGDETIVLSFPPLTNRSALLAPREMTITIRDDD